MGLMADWVQEDEVAEIDMGLNLVTAMEDWEADGIEGGAADAAVESETKL